MVHSAVMAGRIACRRAVLWRPKAYTGGPWEACIVIWFVPELTASGSDEPNGVRNDSRRRGSNGDGSESMEK
jgi:hypothetical protein